MPEISQTPSDVDTVCLAVVQKVAEVTETPPDELPPLYESVNPDALATLFDQPSVPRTRTGKVLFEMAGCTVTVTSEGAISVVEDTNLLGDLHTAESPTTATTPEETRSTPDRV